MSLIPFGAWAPDLGDLNQATSSLLSGAIPQADGYGPFPSLSALTASLPSQCRGIFFAHNNDGSASIFAGTATNLYLLNNVTFTWTNVSAGGGPYVGVGVNANWTFEQFGDVVLATHANVVLQEYIIGTSSAFAATAGSPPQAAYVAIVNQFVVLSGLQAYPFRIQWSGVDDRTQWTPGVESSDYQDMPNGGTVRGVTGGEQGFIIQDQAIRLMLFVPGSPYIFQITRIQRDIGTIAPYSIVTCESSIFFLSAKGFMQMDAASGALTPIGNEIVNRTFLANYDRSYPNLMIGCGVPESEMVIWGYKSLASAVTTAFDTIIGYNFTLSRWFTAPVSGQYVASLAIPSITLESLDGVVPTPAPILGAANNGSGLIRLTVGSTASFSTGFKIAVQGVVGTVEANTQPTATGKPSWWTITVVDGAHLDLQGSTFTHAYVSGGIIGGSLDAYLTSLDDISSVAVPKFAAVNSAGAVGFFTGATLEADIQTPEQGDMQQRLWVSGFYPDTDAQSLYGSIAVREGLQASPAYNGEQPMDVRGFVPARADCRYARAKIRIPAGTTWTYVRGINPVFKKTGRR
jgi:hypothetical protein